MNEWKKNLQQPIASPLIVMKTTSSPTSIPSYGLQDAQRLVLQQARDEVTHAAASRLVEVERQRHAHLPLLDISSSDITFYIEIINMPQCIEGNSLTICNNYIVSSCGFCGGFQGWGMDRERLLGMTGAIGKKIFAQKLENSISYERGFFNSLWVYDISNQTWLVPSHLHDFNERQNINSILINNKIYLFGGFSYTPLSNKALKNYKETMTPLPSKKDTFTYNDGCIIEFCKQDNPNLINELESGDKNIILPLKDDNCIVQKKFDLPFPITEGGIVYDSINKQMYILGGCIYDGKSFNCHWLIPEYDIRIGKVFIRFNMDVNSFPIKDNTVLAEFPGTNRFAQITFIIDNYIYIISGCTNTSLTNMSKGYNEYTLSNVLDNWQYDIKNNTWKRIEDYPIAMCYQGFCVYKNKYVFIFGGTSYNKTTLYEDLLIETSYICKKNTIFPYNNIASIKIPNPSSDATAKEYSSYMSNMIIIYDICNDKYTLSTTHLPFNISSPKVVINDDIIYIGGAEANARLYNDKFYGINLGCMIKLKIIINGEDVTFENLSI